MHNSSWFPKGYSFDDGIKLRKCLLKDDEWQLHITNKDGLALIVASDLYEKWKNSNLIDEHIFLDLCYETSMFKYLVVPFGSIIASVKYGPYPETGSEAEAFAIALNNTRKKIADVSFDDALYLEREGVILPTFKSSEINDDIVLGRWLSQGVNISIENYERICELLSWLPPDEILRISEKAGYCFAQDNSQNKPEYFHAEPDIFLKNYEVRKEELPIEKFELVGRPELESFFNEHVIDIVKNSEKYKRMGIDSPSGIILYGPPGCGKTFAVERLIEYLGWPDFRIDSSSIGSKFIHETSKKISEIFDLAIKNAPSIIVIDEMEAFLTDRNRTTTESGHIEEVAEFLRRIPEALSKSVLIIAMTNMIDAIDPAIRRRGRFDHLIEVKMPSKIEVESLLNHLLKDLPTEKDLAIDKMAEELEGHPMSDVTFVVKEAGRLSVKEAKDTIDNDILFRGLELLPKIEQKKKAIGFNLSVE